MSYRGYSEDDFGGGAGTRSYNEPEPDETPDLRPIPTQPRPGIGTPWDPPIETLRREIYGSQVDIGAHPKGTGSEVFFRVYAHAFIGMPPAEAREVAAALIRAAEEGEARWPEGYFSSPAPEEPTSTPATPTCKGCRRIMASARLTGTCSICRRISNTSAR